MAVSRGKSPAVVSPGEIPCTGSLQEENSQRLRNGYLFLGFLPFKCCQETMTNIIVRKTEYIPQMTYRICLCVPFKVSSPLQLPAAAALHSLRKSKVNCGAIARGKSIHAKGSSSSPVLSSAARLSLLHVYCDPGFAPVQTQSSMLHTQTRMLLCPQFY